MIAYLGYIVFAWVTTKRDIENYCSETRAGSVIADERARALAVGLRLYSPSTADVNGRFHALATSSAVWGRYVCEIEHDGKVVTRTRFQFND